MSTRRARTSPAVVSTPPRARKGLSLAPEALDAPAPRLIGYARVSTDEQTTRQQLDALEAAGCSTTFVDNGVSGSTTTRPELDRCLSELRPGDTLVVWAIDRLGRSLPHLLEVLDRTKSAGVHFRSLTQGIDTNTPCGEMIYAVLGAVAQFERALTVERINAAFAAKKRRGEKCGGREFALSPEQIDAAREMRANGDSLNHVAKVLKVDPSTVWRALRRTADEASA